MVEIYILNFLMNGLKMKNLRRMMADIKPNPDRITFPESFDINFQATSIELEGHTFSILVSYPDNRNYGWTFNTMMTHGQYQSELVGVYLLQLYLKLAFKAYDNLRTEGVVNNTNTEHIYDLLLEQYSVITQKKAQQLEMARNAINEVIYG